MAHDVFISYANQDKPVADAACAVLERRGLRCWIAPRDALPGLEWSAQIVRAIGDATVMVLVYSRNANASQQVKREVERAVAKAIPIVPVRIENVPASETLEYFISTPHWLDAITPPLEQHLNYLADTVALLKDRIRGERPPHDRVVPSAPAPVAHTPPAARRRGLTGLIGGAAVVALGTVGWLIFSGGEDRYWQGTWTTEQRLQNLPARFTLTIDGGSQYRSTVVTRDAGTIRFNNRSFRMQSENGAIAQGMFDLESATSARISGPLGVATWQRELSTATSGQGSPIGIWTMNATIQQLPWTLALAIMPNGRFELTSRSEDAGAFIVKDRSWSLTSTRGFPAQNGTFTRVNERTVTMTGPLGTATWTKQ